MVFVWWGGCRKWRGASKALQDGVPLVHVLARVDRLQSAVLRAYFNAPVGTADGEQLAAASARLSGIAQGLAAVQAASMGKLVIWPEA